MGSTAVAFRDDSHCFATPVFTREHAPRAPRRTREIEKLPLRMRLAIVAAGAIGGWAVPIALAAHFAG